MLAYRILSNSKTTWRLLLVLLLFLINIIKIFNDFKEVKPYENMRRGNTSLLQLNMTITYFFMQYTTCRCTIHKKQSHDMLQLRLGQLLACSAIARIKVVAI